MDELQTYIGRKTDKIWVWTAINHHLPGILAIQLGDRSSQTFRKLSTRIKAWNSKRWTVYFDSEKTMQVLCKFK